MTARRVLGLPLLDVLLAAVLLVASVGSILTGQVDEGQVWLTLPVAVLGCAAFAVRTRWPLAAAVTVALAGLAQSGVGDTGPSSIMALVIVLVVAYSVGAECEETPAVIGLVALLASQLAQEWLDGGTDYVFVVLEVGGAWILGGVARRWRKRARHAEQHQHELSQRAVAEERARIARELHDVVAHGLSVIAVQADAADAALERDPVRAAAALQAIRGSAREALVDMRQLLHVLHDDGDGTDEPGSRAPARGLSDLDALVAGVESTGVPVDARVDVACPVPPGLELAAYRIVQEALTNVRRHAGSVPTRVRVRTAGGVLHVEVSNDAGRHDDTLRQLSSGRGLTGVRERVRAAGGTVHAGPAPDGGFEVVAALPLDGGAA